MAFTFHLTSITPNSHSSLCLSPCPSCLSSDCPSVETQVVSDSWRKNKTEATILVKGVYTWCVFFNELLSSYLLRHGNLRPVDVPVHDLSRCRHCCVNRRDQESLEGKWSQKKSALLENMTLTETGEPQRGCIQNKYRKICCWVWGILVLSDNTRIIWLFWTFICSPPRRKKTNHHFETKFLFF